MSCVVILGTLTGLQATMWQACVAVPPLPPAPTLPVEMSAWMTLAVTLPDDTVSLPPLRVVGGTGGAGSGWVEVRVRAYTGTYLDVRSA